ncbi:MAG: helix-turn-helix domain-containing protein, partial [Gammaproteobacteria bacterium]
MSTQSVSQSVARMVAILEAFERERRPLTSAELIALLEAPRSSVAALLRAMVDLSVLSLDRRSATYLPTAHFARLAAWLDEAIVREPRVLEMLKTVQEACSETVTLSAPTDLCMEILRVERGNLVISFIAEPGQQITFWGSAIGTAYLSTLAAPALASLYERSRRHGGALAPTQPLEEIRRQVEQAREGSCARAFGAVFADAGAIATPLPPTV